MKEDEMLAVYLSRPRHYPFFKIQGRLPIWLKNGGLKKDDVVVLVSSNTMALRDNLDKRFAAHPSCMKFLYYSQIRVKK